MRIDTDSFEYDTSCSPIVKRRTLTCYLKNITRVKNVLVALNLFLICLAFYHHGKKINDNKVLTLVDQLDQIHNVVKETRMKHHVQKRDIEKQKQAAAEEAQRRALQQELRRPHAGATYVRWGRKDCSGTEYTKLIYKGIAAGGQTGHTGGGANVLCLKHDIVYNENEYRDGTQSSSFIYGLEYKEGAWADSLFDLSLISSGTYRDQNVPCAVCLAKETVSQLMIPGRDECPQNWRKEYSGYIMSAGHGNAHTSSYMCVDDKLEVVYGSQGSQGGGVLYLVETQCPSLQCEPYVNGRELRCVVCTIPLDF